MKKNFLLKHKIIILAVMFLIAGCAGKKDTINNISMDDKKLLSSYTDKVLYLKNDIRITENGFYPNYKISSNVIKYNYGKYAKQAPLYNNRFYTKVLSYSRLKKFNVKKFIDIVKQENLLSYRNKLLELKSVYPTVETRRLTSNLFNSLLTEKNILQHISWVDSCYKKPLILRKGSLDLREEDQMMLLNDNPSYVLCINKPTDKIKFLAIRKKNHLGNWIKVSENLQQKIIHKHPEIWSKLKHTYHSSNLYILNQPDAVKYYFTKLKKFPKFQDNEAIRKLFKQELKKPKEKIDRKLDFLTKYLKNPSEKLILLALEKKFSIRFFININRDIALTKLDSEPNYIDIIANPSSQMLHHPKVLELYRKRKAIAQWNRDHPVTNDYNYSSSSSNSSSNSSSSSSSSSSQECHYRIHTIRVPGGNGRRAQTSYIDCN